MASTPAPSSAPPSRRRELAWLAIGMPLMFRVGFAQFFASDRNLASYQDNTYLLVPIFSYLSNSFSHGSYPYWMNTIMSGIAMYNDPDFSTAYPFYFLRFGFYSTPLAAMRTIHWVIIFHLLVLYVNSYVMLRCMRVSPLPSFLGSSVFTFSQNTISYAGWINITASYAWFPLVLGAVVLILDRRLVGRAIVIGALSFALLILASPSQSLIHALYAIGLFFWIRAIGSFVRHESAAPARAARDLACMGGGAFVLAAPSLVPSLLNVREMIRFIGDFPPITGNARMPFEATLVGQLSPTELAGVLLPFKAPIIVGCAFVGLSVVLFALFALCRYRTNWLVLPLWLLTVYALVSATGQHLGLARVNYHLPFLNMVREPPRHLFVFVLAISSLAAIGFDYVTDVVRQGRAAVVTAGHLAIFILFAAVSTLALRAPLPYVGTVPLAMILGGFLAVLAFLLAALWAPARARPLFFAASAIVAILANLPYPPKERLLANNDYFRPANLAAHQTLAALARIDGIRSYRILFESDELPSAFWSMNASYYGLRSFQAFKNPMPSARQFEEVYQRFDVRHYYPLLGARYYLCQSCEHVDLGNYRLDRQINGHKLYVAEEAFPHYTVIGHVAGVYDTPKQFYDAVHAGFDFDRKIYLDRTVSVPGLAELSDPARPTPRYVLKEESSSLNALELSVNVDRKAILLLNEYFTDAWKATINGRTIAPIRVNLNQVGVILNAGANLVRLEYRPTLFIWLLRLQSVAAVALVVYGAFPVGARRQGFRRWYLRCRESGAP